MRISKPRANDEHHRQRDFGHNERAADVMASSAAGPSVPALLERGHEVMDPSLRDGRGPKSTPVAIDTPSAKNRTDRSMAISLIRGTLVGYARISACTATRASHRPSMPPATHSITPSVIVCRSSRLRLAQSRAHRKFTTT